MRVSFLEIVVILLHDLTAFGLERQLVALERAALPSLNSFIEIDMKLSEGYNLLRVNMSVNLPNHDLNQEEVL